MPTQSTKFSEGDISKVIFRKFKYDFRVKDRSLFSELTFPENCSEDIPGPPSSIYGVSVVEDTRSKIALLSCDESAARQLSADGSHCLYLKMICNDAEEFPRDLKLSDHSVTIDFLPHVKMNTETKVGRMEACISTTEVEADERGLPRYAVNYSTCKFSMSMNGRKVKTPGWLISYNDDMPLGPEWTAEDRNAVVGMLWRTYQKDGEWWYFGQGFVNREVVEEFEISFRFAPFEGTLFTRFESEIQGPEQQSQYGEFAIARETLLSTSAMAMSPICFDRSGSLLASLPANEGQLILTDQYLDYAVIHFTDEKDKDQGHKVRNARVTVELFPRVENGGAASIGRVEGRAQFVSAYAHPGPRTRDSQFKARITEIDIGTVNVSAASLKRQWFSVDFDKVLIPSDEGLEGSVLGAHLQTRGVVGNKTQTGTTQTVIAGFYRHKQQE